MAGEIPTEKLMIHLRPLLLTVLPAFLAAGSAWAASPYDDYYNNYHQPDAQQQAPAQPVDNDSYYTPPGNYRDNDSYYTAPQPSNYGVNCNTIGDMASCSGG